jgi:hypothetical protein
MCKETGVKTGRFALSLWGYKSTKFNREFNMRAQGCAGGQTPRDVSTDCTRRTLAWIDFHRVAGSWAIWIMDAAERANAERQARW